MLATLIKRNIFNLRKVQQRIYVALKLVSLD